MEHDPSDGKTMFFNVTFEGAPLDTPEGVELILDVLGKAALRHKVLNDFIAYPLHLVQYRGRQ